MQITIKVELSGPAESQDPEIRLAEIVNGLIADIVGKKLPLAGGVIRDERGEWLGEWWREV